MGTKLQADIKGKMIPCPRLSTPEIGAGVISLGQCKECGFHQGTSRIREANPEAGQLEIDNVTCGLPTQIRVIYHLGGLN